MCKLNIICQEKQEVILSTNITCRRKHHTDRNLYGGYCIACMQREINAEIEATKENVPTWIR